MRESHPRERVVGIDHYVSGADGVGGRLRDRPEDFRVRELEAFDVHPVDADTGDYPYLVLRATLRGWDTNDFASRLSDALGASRERVDWAGTKDKYAVTTQLFTVYDADPGDLPEIRDADVEVVGRAGRHLSFGDLAGNAFEITVRDPERPANAATITASLAQFAGVDAGGDESDVAGAAADGVTVGVPNFFGHQRFGSVRPVTHEVGLHVVRREWREAVLSYVGNPVEAEPADTWAARGLVDEEAATENPDWHACLEEMPRKLGFERSMLHRLADDGSETDADWRHALEAVPSNLQRLFVNAAQSYAFNRMLSERLERGLPFHRPVDGDVCCFADRVERRSADGGSQSNDDGAAAVERPDPDRTQRATESRVDVLTRHCERGRAFVTAPLVGTATELTDGEQGEIERAVLDDLDLEPAMFDLPGEFESTGTRRAVLARTEMRAAREPLTFSFALPSGSYATTMLREYLKVDPTAL